MAGKALNSGLLQGAAGCVHILRDQGAHMASVADNEVAFLVLVKAQGSARAQMGEGVPLHLPAAGTSPVGAPDSPILVQHVQVAIIRDRHSLCMSTEHDK